MIAHVSSTKHTSKVSKQNVAVKQGWSAQSIGNGKDGNDEDNQPSDEDIRKAKNAIRAEKEKACVKAKQEKGKH